MRNPARQRFFAQPHKRPEKMPMSFWTINRIVAACALFTCAVSSAFTLATFLYLLSAIATDQGALAWNVAIWFARFMLTALASVCVAVLLMSHKQRKPQ
jgi:ABC-type multidrug transport system permease subunit